MENSMYTFKTETLDITLAANQSQNSEKIRIDEAVEVRVAAVVKGTVDKILNLGFYEQGQVINDPMDVSLWKRIEIGQHPIDGFFPLNSKGNKDIEARLIAPEVFNSAINVQLVFAIKQVARC
ncbi:hypothetical protein [Aquimarina litoralis]|uniref:hypothetical protein n=1 Tax=Aquimarina litoralis TaxID=584605 RepID=UPI001C579BCD|nr:hypothetical protein [Aquimarina litoralis]MBW1296433.1 hypothetical protein [Aquimarina litoralis]